VSLAFNALSYRTVLRRKGAEITLTDEAADDLWVEARAAGLPCPRDFFITVMQTYARRHAYHPIRDYLAGLEWDGIDRIDTWLTLLGAEDTELNRAYGRKTLIGAVRRVRRPGAKHDTILVLQGPQGKGKSSAIRALCPDEEFFSDSLGIGDDQKHVIEATAGKWLIELAELSGMGKRDANAVKSMLSRMVDAARLSYGRLSSERPRQFILFGSVNEEQYLAILLATAGSGRSRSAVRSIRTRCAGISSAPAISFGRRPPISRRGARTRRYPSAYGKSRPRASASG
jgi:predicted P-loop ATPase